MSEIYNKDTISHLLSWPLFNVMKYSTGVTIKNFNTVLKIGYCEIYQQHTLVLK